MRRAKGEGSITRRKDGRWQARYQVNGGRKYIYGKTRKEVAKKLTEALPDAEVGAVDDAGIIEVRLEAPDFEEALHLVWNGIAAAGCDDHIAFAEHPDIPEHWRERTA